MTDELLDLSLIEKLHLWSELTECFHGVHGYGGNVAEIYAYRFWRYSPVLELAARDGTLGRHQDLLQERKTKASRALVLLVDLFTETYSCNATIDGLHPREWLVDVGEKFDWRAYVEVIKK